MKFSENWLREKVDVPVDRAGLCHRLTMAGLEVEGVEVLGEGLAGVVVGEIVACEQHPNADRLRVCQVATGGEALLQIVCGAPNARPGLKAPLAMVGASLPNGVEIKPAVLRGVESQGMLCSARELGLDVDASGLMELPADAPTGMPLAAYLALPDASIELKLTPNRPDCLGLRGLSYDVAALFGTQVREDALDAAVEPRSTRRREVRLEAGADCPRYLGRVIEGIDATAASPLWMRERLRRAGLRPISAVVDVTNYVMLELGQPLHAFDDDTLHGAIVVRHAVPGEKLRLLDGSEVVFAGDAAAPAPSFLLIADEREALAVAGVMGGHASRVTDVTRNVFLESAHFAPAAIMGRARRLGLHTDASHRFERGVDPELPRQALERATALLIAIAGGTPGPVVEAVRPGHLPSAPVVRLRRERLRRVLGMRVDDAEVERILGALGIRVTAEADGWQVVPPSRRFDIAIEEDLIEEVVRVHGYERVPTRAPSGELRLMLCPEAEVAPRRLRAQLAARGYHEAVSYSFVAPELLERWSCADGAEVLANPLSTDLAVMRTSLLPGLVEALRHNLNRQQERVRLFELGRVFHRDAEGPRETVRVALVACGRAAAESWAAPDKRGVDFFDVKGDIESLVALGGHRADVRFAPLDRPALHPGRSAAVLIDGREAGVLGSLHPRLLKALDLDLDVYVAELDLAPLTAGVLPQAEELSRFPMVRRDIAVFVPETVTWAEIQASVRAALGEVLTEVRLFDLYQGANLGDACKSLAIGLILQDRYRTLTDQDAGRCVALAVSALERDCHAKLRG